MFAVAVDKGQLKKVLALVAAVAVLAVVVIAVGGRLMGGHAPDGIPGDTAEKRESYLTSMGLEFSKSSTLVEVAVPEQFDERFAVYNEMLKKPASIWSRTRARRCRNAPISSATVPISARMSTPCCW